MNQAEKAKYETRARVLKALAHPARLKLVDVLSEHEEVCVCELTEAIGTDMSTVSRHLTQLKNAGIVDSEKHGQMVFYRRSEEDRSAATLAMPDPPASKRPLWQSATLLAAMLAFLIFSDWFNPGGQGCQTCRWHRVCRDAAIRNGDQLRPAAEIRGAWASRIRSRTVGEVGGREHRGR